MTRPSLLSGLVDVQSGMRSSVPVVTLRRVLAVLCFPILFMRSIIGKVSERWRDQRREREREREMEPVSPRLLTEHYHILFLSPTEICLSPVRHCQGLQSLPSHVSSPDERNLFMQGISWIMFR